MALQHILLQKLQRNQHNGDIEFISREQLNRVDGPIYSLFEQARNAMHRSSAKQVGSFDSTTEHAQLIGLVKSWHDNSIDFVAFAKRAALLLQLQMMPTEDPFSAMLLIAHEVMTEQQLLYVLWLPEQDMLTSGNDMEPVTGRMIVPEKIQYGFCLNVSDWLKDKDDTTCLTVLCSRGNKLFSEAFTRFASFTQRIDSSRQTTEFLAIVDQFSNQLPKEKSQPIKSAILDYCVSQDKIGQPVSIKALSERLDESEPTRFANFVSEQKEAPDDTVYTHRQSLKRYMRYFGRDHSLSISFSAERIDQDIVYEPTTGSLVIRKLPKNLKQQLTGFTEPENDTL